VQNIAVLMPSAVRPFELSLYCEVFGIDRTADGVPAFDFAVVSERPAVPSAAIGGLQITATAGLDRLAAADVVAVTPSPEPAREVSPAVAGALRDAVRRGSRVVALCTAAFTLASAGLLDGRRVATHWMWAGELARRFPRVRVDPDVLYVDDDPIFTSAGTAAGIDLCLHLVRKDHGAAAAAAIARRMVVPPHRSAGQAQIVGTPITEVRRDDGIAPLLDWAVGNLHEDLSVDVLARRSFQSRRSFARRFRAVTGTTPHAWLLDQRVARAQFLLEERPDLTVEDIATHAGFPSAAMLRQHFQRRLGCSPSEYRGRARDRWAGQPCPPYGAHVQNRTAVAADATARIRLTSRSRAGSAR
jgi:AraC family transcriptional regulator, transcriptional activator FtrA